MLLINFCGQYAHLIARGIRDLVVHSEAIPIKSEFRGNNAKRSSGSVLSGA